MTLEEALMTYLLAQPQVTAQLGTHVFAEIASTDKAKQLRQGHPFCTFTQKNGAAVEHMTGVTALHEAVLGVDVFAYDAHTRALAAQALATAFHAWRTTQAGHAGLDVRYAKVVNGEDAFIEPTDGTDRVVYQRSLDVRLWYLLV